MRKGKHTARILSATEIADELNVHRTTVLKWTRDGCPYVRKADAGRGVSWGFDLGAVFAWWGDYQAERKAAEAGRSSIAQLERQAAEVRLELLELSLAEKRRDVIRVDDAAEIVEREYERLRRRIRALPRSAAAEAALAVQRAADAPAGEAAVEDVLEREVEECLATLSGINGGAGGGNGAPAPPVAPDGSAAPGRKARRPKARRPEAGSAADAKRVGRRKSNSKRRGKRRAGAVADPPG